MLSSNVFSKMNLSQIISELEKNKIIFKSLLENLPSDFYLWREDEAKWNLLEITCHLYDEERDDFRDRVQSVLENPEAKLKPINSGDWVLERKYSEQNYNDKLNGFLTERDKSIEWLKNLSNPKWDNTYVHEKLGPLTAGMFLVNWLAHDYLHMRQINRAKYNYLKETTGENLEYAGGW